MRVLIELQLSFILLRSVSLCVVLFDVNDLIDELCGCDCVEMTEVSEANRALVEGISVEASVFV